MISNANEPFNFGDYATITGANTSNERKNIYTFRGETDPQNYINLSLKKNGLYLIQGVYALSKTDNGYRTTPEIDGLFYTNDNRYKVSFEFQDNNTFVNYGTFYDVACRNHYSGVTGFVPFMCIIKKTDAGVEIVETSDNSLNLTNNMVEINIKNSSGGVYWLYWDNRGKKTHENIGKLKINQILVGDNFKFSNFKNQTFGKNEYYNIKANDSSKADNIVSANKKCVVINGQDVRVMLLSLIHAKENWGEDYTYACLGNLGVYPLEIH